MEQLFPGMKRRVVVSAVFTVLVLFGGGWLGWRVQQAHGIAAGYIPKMPDVSGRPPELAERIAAAEKDAHGYFHPGEGLAELSRLYHANGFFDEALRCYDGLQRLQPHEAKWPHLEAGILASYGRLEEAQPLYLKAAMLAPDYLPARLRLGEVMLKANRTADAARIYADVLKRSPDQPYALLGLARCALAADDWERAHAELQRAVAANPDFVGGLSLLASVEEHLGRTADADALRARVGRREFADLTDAWAESLIEDCYDPYQLSVAAAVAHFRGENATATQRLERAIALSDAPAPYYRQLGKLLLGDGELIGARSNLEQAAALDPTDADTWVLLVNMLEKTDRAEAYRKVNAGLVKCPESWALHLAYGRMLSADGQLDRALPQLQEAKRLRPSEVNSYIELALAYFKRGAVDEGVNEMKQALVVQPDQPLALVVMARDAISRGDEPGARGWIRRIKLQTRVRAEDVQTVATEFREKFGQLP